MRKLQEGTKIAAVSAMGTIEHGVILEKADSPTSKDVYLVRWLGDGTSTLFEVKKENLITEDKDEKRNTRRKSKKQSK